jgi:GntR family transcriptional repressor for pyruvate dehydrogenase complex
MVAFSANHSNERVARSSVGADVVERLKQRIASGELGPGDRLPSQRALGETMGVSLPTVREAIRSLTNLGLLEARHGSGTYVTSLRADELMRSMRFAMSLSDRSLGELFDVRLMLEPAAARAAAERRTTSQLAEMQTCIDESLADGVTHDRLLELDVRLHQVVVEATRNALLLQLMDSIAALGTESRTRTISLPGVEPETIHDHQRIVNAIRARRAAASERAMRAHIERIRGIAAASGLPAQLDWRLSRSM